MTTPENQSSSASARSTASNTADSYLGSLISLTSKSEIRYEGVLYNINTDESSIGLNHVRSFGTEGRKKDGPQVPPSDKVYEYILFRGSDIKDLQVKSSTPLQSAPAINNDPAIIHSHYPRPVSTSTSLPAAASGPSSDTVSSVPQMALGSNLQGGHLLYQPGGNLGSWGASPTPNTGGSGLAMPMYWQGYYPPLNGLPHLPQQSLLRPPPGLQMPAMQQRIPIPYPGFNTSFPTEASNFPGPLPEGPSLLFPPSGNSFSMTSISSVSLPSNVSTIAPVTLPSTITPIPSATPSSDALFNPMPHKVQASPFPPVGANPNFMPLPPLINTTPANILAPSLTTKPNPILGPTFQFQSTSQPALSIMGESDSANAESANVALQTLTPLITPGHLLQSGSSDIPSSQNFQSANKDLEIVQVSPSSPKPSATLNADTQPPILPLPPQARPIDKSGAPFQSRYGYRGRDRGRGARVQNSHPAAKFTEDFDFMAMNEKFKKDEVWGHLGKNSKHQSKDKDSDGHLSEEESFPDDGNESSKIDNKSVYNKDDFFDSLSCNALDGDFQNGRTRFSEQMKLDTETFGDFSRYRGGQFGRSVNRGGGRTRGYYGRGYSYGSVRGRGRGTYARPL